MRSLSLLSTLATARRDASITGDAGTTIVGGDEVTHCDYEFMVALLWGDGSTRGCGGALLDKRKVLTAAHCVGPPFADNLQVAIGINRDDNFSSCSKHEVINVVGLDIHPSLDIAMLTLAEDSKLTPAKYDCGINFDDGQSVLVSGFGATS